MAPCYLSMTFLKPYYYIYCFYHGLYDCSFNCNMCFIHYSLLFFLTWKCLRAGQQVITVHGTYFCVIFFSGLFFLWPIWKFREGGEQRGVKERRVVGRRVEGNGYPLPCLDVFKISKGKLNNQSFLLFECFKNQEGEETK